MQSTSLLIAFKLPSQPLVNSTFLTTSPSKSKDREAAHTLCGFTVYLVIHLLLIIRFREKECALAHSYAEA